MFGFCGLPVFVLISFPLAALSGRVYLAQRSDGGPHKCSIHWEVPERGIAKTSFPVKSCRLHCKATFTDNHYDKKFANVLKVAQSKKSCKCLQLDGKPILKMVGKCPAEAERQCFDHYKTLRTSTFVLLPGRETTTVQHDFRLQEEKTFDYSVCEENACMDGNCTEGSFPSIMEGRGNEEKNMIADIIRKQKEAPGSLGEGEQEIVDQLTDEDIIDIMGDEWITTATTTTTTDEIKAEYDAIVDEASGPFTVAMLRKIYKKKLEGTVLSVDHLLNVADLTDDDQEVDLEAFKRFVQPDCP